LRRMLGVAPAGADPPGGPGLERSYSGLDPKSIWRTAESGSSKRGPPVSSARCCGRSLHGGRGVGAARAGRRAEGRSQFDVAPAPVTRVSPIDPRATARRC
jgi:hypothetical protein